RLIDRIPIWTAVDHVRRRHFVLQESCAAIVIAVRMRNDDIFDLVHVDTQFSHPVCDLVGRGVVIERLEDDDDLAPHERPGSVDFRPEEIGVVCDLRWLGVPRSLCRRSARPVPRDAARIRWRRYHAQAEKCARPLEAGGDFRSGHQAVHGGSWWRLRGDEAGAGHDGDDGSTGDCTRVHVVPPVMRRSHKSATQSFYGSLIACTVAVVTVRGPLVSVTRTPQVEEYHADVTCGCRATVCEEVFKPAVARKNLRRYLKKGLGAIERKLVAAIPARDIAGARVLEIGGGIGPIQAELLAKGAGTGEIVELVSAYAPFAQELAAAKGFQGKTRFLVADVLETPDIVAPARIVVLNRVVCCSP